MKASTTQPDHREKPSRRIHVRLAWGIAVLACTALTGFLDMHDFHFSRTDMHWNPESNTVQTTLRVFTDDLERAIRNHHGLGNEVHIWLGDPQEWPGADNAIAEWLDANLTLKLADSAMTWTWVGKEVELDICHLYLESPTVSGQGATWTVTNRVFFNEFADQVNEVYIKGMSTDGTPSERREMLNWELPTFVWESGDHETKSDHE